MALGNVRYDLVGKLVEETGLTRADCRRLMDGNVDARTLAAEILARRRAQRG